MTELKTKFVVTDLKCFQGLPKMQNKVFEETFQFYNVWDKYNKPEFKITY